MVCNCTDTKRHAHREDKTCFLYVARHHGKTTEGRNCVKTGGTIWESVEKATERYLWELEEDQEDGEAGNHTPEEYKQDGSSIPWKQAKQEPRLR